MTYLSGKIGLDINAGAPNNGKGDVKDLGVIKSTYIERKRYPYVSAQAVRRWMRDSLPTNEPRSPVTAIARKTGAQRQQAYTSGRPDLFLDDDVFGYMVAVKEKGGTVQRETVLGTGTLLATKPGGITEDFGAMTRGFGADERALLHRHEFFTAVLGGDIIFDLARVGIFEANDGGIRTNLTAEAVKESLKNGATEMAFRGIRAVCLPLAERQRRVAVILRTLAEVRGGAKQALHACEVTPAFVLLAPVHGGNNPFSRVLNAEGFDADTFREEMDAWAGELAGPVMIGWNPGFLGDQREIAKKDLADLIASGAVSIGHPRTMLRDFAAEIENGKHSEWFTDEMP